MALDDAGVGEYAVHLVREEQDKCSEICIGAKFFYGPLGPCVHCCFTLLCYIPYFEEYKVRLVPENRMINAIDLKILPFEILRFPLKRLLIYLSLFFFLYAHLYLYSSFLAFFSLSLSY